METICFTATARIRQPRSNLIYFDDYRNHMETEKLAAKPPSDLRKVTKRRTLKGRLELICLCLEASVCVSILLLTLTVTVRFFAS